MIVRLNYTLKLKKSKLLELQIEIDEKMTFLLWLQLPFA
ncbi:hypothetical protein PTUN_a1912 [Pseudoalteromonas tunicata]|nr:hypothetical protein PTUN_a1912 [Pseudoalteromonas tunicata]